MFPSIRTKRVVCMQFFLTWSYKPRYNVEFSSRIWSIDEQTFEMLVMAAQGSDLVIYLIDDVKLYGIWCISNSGFSKAMFGMMYIEAG